VERELLLAAYRHMRTIRTFEERVSAEFAANHIPGFVHLCVGQEACAVGVCMHLEERDYIGSTHRGHGHCIAKGCDPKGMMLEIFGKVGGLCGGKGGSMHIADLERGMLGANGIVGGGPPLAIDTQERPRRCFLYRRRRLQSGDSLRSYEYGRSAAIADCVLCRE